MLNDLLLEQCEYCGTETATACTTLDLRRPRPVFRWKPLLHIHCCRGCGGRMFDAVRDASAPYNNAGETLRFRMLERTPS